MLQNIIVIVIVAVAVILLIRHFINGKCSCECSSSKTNKPKGSSCGGCSLKEKK